jgi:UDP-N-acetylmuramoylalanine--D-glutamate ligase
MGKDNEKILNAFKNKIEIIVESGSMQEALKAASLYANSGDVVLLSPACASFDLFNNYQHRGNVFKEILSSAMAELENK